MCETVIHLELKCWKRFQIEFVAIILIPKRFLHELWKLLNAENVFSCLKLLNIDWAAGAGLALRADIPQAEKKRDTKI